MQYITHFPTKERNDACLTHFCIDLEKHRVKDEAVAHALTRSLSHQLRATERASEVDEASSAEQASELAFEWGIWRANERAYGWKSTQVRERTNSLLYTSKLSAVLDHSEFWFDEFLSSTIRSAPAVGKKS